MADTFKNRSSFPTNRITDLGFRCIQNGSVYYMHDKRIVYNDYLSLTEQRDRYYLDSFSARYYDDRVVPIKWVASKASDIKIKNIISYKNDKLKTNFKK